MSSPYSAKGTPAQSMFHRVFNLITLSECLFFFGINSVHTSGTRTARLSNFWRRQAPTFFPIFQKKMMALCACVRVRERERDREREQMHFLAPNTPGRAGGVGWGGAVRGAGGGRGLSPTNEFSGHPKGGTRTRIDFPLALPPLLHPPAHTAPAGHTRRVRPYYREYT